MASPARNASPSRFVRSIQRACSSACGLATTIAPKVSSPSRIGYAAARYVRSHPRGLEVERLHAAGVHCLLVQQAHRKLPQPGGLTREDLGTRVVEARAGRLLERRWSEARRAKALVDTRGRLERVQLGEALGLAAKLGERPRAGVLLEEPNRDGRRHERRHQHAEEEDRRKPKAQRAQHCVPSRTSGRAGGLGLRGDLVAHAPDGDDRARVPELAP